MKPLTALLVLALALVLARPAAPADAPPTDWVDPATGHRVIRLSGDGGGSSLYFHQNTYTPRGDKLVFDTKAGIVAVDLTKLGKEPVKADLIVPGARAISVAWRTPDVYHRKAGALYATNLETKAERKVVEARGSVVNADETLVVGFENDPEAPAKVKELGLPMLVTADLVDRTEPPGRLRPGGRSLAIVVTDVKSGESKKIHYSTEWLNHLQASPADPRRLLFCHEGAWQVLQGVSVCRQGLVGTVFEGRVGFEVEHIRAGRYGGDDGGPTGHLNAELVAADVRRMVGRRVDVGCVQAGLRAAELVLRVFVGEAKAEDCAVAAHQADAEGEGLCMREDACEGD